jgi:hypothetical protein
MAQDAIAIGKQKAADVAARRTASRTKRAQVLAAHPNRVTINVSISTAGYLVAAGDSWFDYPIHDVLTMLEENYGYNVESSAHAGDAIESMAYQAGQLDKFAQCLDKVLALGVKPKAALLSGGGDDIAGTEFGMLLNNATSPIAGWNAEIVDGVINQRIAEAYRVMVTAIDSLCESRGLKDLPIVVHGYDYPVPDGRGFLGGWWFLPGPWLKPGFNEKLFEDTPTNAAMMKQIIDQFNAMSAKLPAEFANVHFVDLRGTLSNNPANYTDWWANELHPTEQGFTAVAAKFAMVLETL